ncbi:MAG: hypothetical protein L3J56_07980, partial [Bacteroidales bacterium]|nr:hypothetical protein [Bacteroidales bacterium]
LLYLSHQQLAYPVFFCFNLLDLPLSLSKRLQFHFQHFGQYFFTFAGTAHDVGTLPYLFYQLQRQYFQDKEKIRRSDKFYKLIDI